jgi:hypothetical protein
MRAAEFMRTLADIIDHLDNKPSQIDDEERPLEKGDVMIPPLQQKIEIFKKMSDTPSSSQNPNVVGDITVINADEDEPFEG